MNVALFFTYDYTLSLWNNSGTLEKELKIYKNLSDKFGIKFTFFTYGDESELIYEKQLEGINLVPIYSTSKRFQNKLLRFLYSFFIPFKLKKYIKPNQIIQQHQLSGVWVTLIMKLITKNPLYLRTGYDTYEFSIKQKNSLLVRMFYRILTSISLKYADTYSVASNSDYVFLNNKFNTSKTNLVIRPNWTEIGILNQGKRVKNKILSVGRLEDQKNYELLLKEFSNTSNEFTIDIVGTGEKRRILENLAKTLKVDVNFLGSLENDKLLSLYENYCFYISTSKYEGNPKTILEAMAAGCVVLASNISNHKELIENSVDGFLFDLSSPNLYALIKEISESSNLINKISKKAYEKVKRHNSINLITDKYYFDYKDLTYERFDR